jgi:uncharacterized cysteine cluster protein YcgN (CxxCxxCC family)
MLDASWRQFSAQRGTEVAQVKPTPMETCERCGQVCYVHILEEAPFCYEELIAGKVHRFGMES